MAGESNSSSYAVPLLGGVGGGVSNYFSQGADRKKYKQQIKSNQQLQAEIADLARMREQQSEEAYGGLLQGYPQNAQDYFNALANEDAMQYVQEMPGEFEYDKEGAIDEYKARNQGALDEMIKRSLGDIEAEGAASGSLYSGATGKSIARSTADITANALKEAENYAQNEEQNKYQRYVDRFNQARDIAQQKLGASQTNLGNKGNIFSAQSGIFGNLRGEVTGIQGAADTARMQSRADEEAARVAKAGTTRGAASFFQGFGAGL